MFEDATTHFSNIQLTVGQVCFAFNPKQFPPCIEFKEIWHFYILYYCAILKYKLAENYNSRFYEVASLGETS